MSKELIADFQRRLMALKYELPTYGADGDFGNETHDAAMHALDDLANAGVTPSKKTKPVEDTDGDLPPWIAIGKKVMGLNEITDNKELAKFLKSDGAALGDPAKNPWCGDYTETCIKLALPDEKMIENPYWALNWLKFGVEVPKDKFLMGAIGVKKRDGGGHVFFIVGHDKDYVHALGGNQSNSVSIVKIAKKDVEGMRYPKTYPMPKKAMPTSTFNGKISTSEA